ncbi:uncharacterized protein LOC123557861 [Mercenaria mercenaria]|uniref:uncharacterized protein LOC123557861 n=1 Tax=Mercenaria mercenaria TaxID=6596 RepID=UPI00234F12FC|nr:uncharacterized protein LOC123557861 [Mercenaria mercenaria]
MDEQQKIQTEEFTIDDSFTGESGEYDLTLIVDGHKIRVMKVVLCLASPVFRAMLQSEFKEKDQAEVELPGKKHQDFVEFLSCFYPDKLEQVTGDTVYRILPLAFDYQVNVLQKRCHARLIEVVKTSHLADAIEINRHIQLAEMYELKDLRKICISAASDFKLKDLEKAVLEYPIPENILVQIHHLARRKQELNKTDDDYMKNLSQSSNYAGIIAKEMESSMQSYMHSSNSNRLFRSLRLWYRFFQGEEERLEKIIKSLKGKKVNNEVKEEYELLPETVKQRLNLDHQN